MTTPLLMLAILTAPLLIVLRLRSLSLQVAPTPPAFAVRADAPAVAVGQSRDVLTAAS